MDELNEIALKKQKNLEKMLKYQQRKTEEGKGGRVFKQRKPITSDHVG